MIRIDTYRRGLRRPIEASYPKPYFSKIVCRLINRLYPEAVFLRPIQTSSLGKVGSFETTT